jgi:uncharacterized protein YdaU (DUF1376 family)
MASRPQWIRFFFGDFFAAVQFYNVVVAGAYIRSLCYYWQVTNCQGIEDNTEDMKAMCGLSDKDWDAYGKTVFGKLFTLDGQGLWQQKRAREEWDRAILMSSERSERAKLGAVKRWNK